MARRLSASFGELTSDDLSGGRAFTVLYGTMMSEVLEDRHERHFGRLWATLAPTGNIYRYISHMQEFLKHCDDLGQQMRELAEEHAPLLGGRAATLDERVEALHLALKATAVRGCPGGTAAGIAEAPLGFRPLDEFLECPVSRFGPVLLPREKEQRAEWWKNHTIALLVFTVQVVGVFITGLEMWHRETNQLRDLSALWARLTFREAICLGSGFDESLTTVMGVMFLFLGLFITWQYAVDELENASKSAQLPSDALRSGIGVFANAWVCLGTAFAMPLMFWEEEDTQGIVVDSLQLLFLFTLDDLTGDICGYLGIGDSEFQRQASYNLIMLSQCPLTLRDITARTPEAADQIWNITFDDMGNLLKAGAEANLARCETRVMIAAECLQTQAVGGTGNRKDNVEMSQLTSPLAPGGDSSRAAAPGGSGGTGSAAAPDSQAAGVDNDRAGAVRPAVPASARLSAEGLIGKQISYCTSPSVPARFIPDFRGRLRCHIWRSTTWILTILQIVVPIGWFVVNKPCYED